MFYFVNMKDFKVLYYKYQLRFETNFK